MPTTAFRSGASPMYPNIRGARFNPQYFSDSVPMRASGTVLGGGSFSSNEGFELPTQRALLDSFSGGEPDYFNELNTIRERNTGTAQNNLNQYRNDLETGINDYSTSANGSIDAYGNNLGRLSSDYLSKTDAQNAADEAERRRLRMDFGRASRLGVRSAINNGIRSSKAMFSSRGGAGGSYADRLAIGFRAKAETDAANQLAELDRADALAMSEARRRRDDIAFNTGRSDAGALFGERSRLNSDIFGRRTGNLGALYGEQSRLNENDARQFRTDLGATRLITPRAGSLLPEESATLPRNPRARLLSRNRLSNYA